MMTAEAAPAAAALRDNPLFAEPAEMHQLGWKQQQPAGKGTEEPPADQLRSGGMDDSASAAESHGGARAKAAAAPRAAGTSPVRARWRAVARASAHLRAARVRGSSSTHPPSPRASLSPSAGSSTARRPCPSPLRPPRAELPN